MCCAQITKVFFFFICGLVLLFFPKKQRPPGRYKDILFTHTPSYPKSFNIRSIFWHKLFFCHHNTPRCMMHTGPHGCCYTHHMVMNHSLQMLLSVMHFFFYHQNIILMYITRDVSSTAKKKIAFFSTHPFLRPSPPLTAFNPN